MNAKPPKRSFAARPDDPRAGSRPPMRRHPALPESTGFTARLTVDVTPALRGRIKIAAFQREQTVAADMLRDLLARHFPETPGDAP